MAYIHSVNDTPRKTSTLVAITVLIIPLTDPVDVFMTGLTTGPLTASIIKSANVGLKYTNVSQ